MGTCNYCEAVYVTYVTNQDLKSGPTFNFRYFQVKKKSREENVTETDFFERKGKGLNTYITERKFKNWMEEIAGQQTLFTQQDVKYMVVFISETLERN